MQNIQNDILKGFGNVNLSVDNLITRLPMALLVIIVGVVAIKFLGLLINKSITWTKWPIGLQEISVALIKVVMWVIFFLILLQVLGLTNVALALTGSFAIVLLGFSNAISTTVSDVLAGLQLANDKDFKVGYEVKAGDQKTVGIVREMDIKKTRIEGKDGKLHVIPNSLIEKNEWVVLDRHVHSKMPTKSSGIISKAKSKIKKEDK
jgi:small conductance mechanosensitive channel